MQYLLLLVVVAGCGRIGFDSSSDARTADAPAIDAAPDALTCGSGYTIQPPGVASRYRLVTTQRNWLDAQADCESDGGHLPVIGDDPENLWVASNATSGDVATWIGLSDHVTEGTFRWVTTVTTQYNRFDMGEPNDSSGEDCVQTFMNDQNWNDVVCKSVMLFYACECDGAPVPAVRTYCDTQYDAGNCGQCGNQCGGALTCQDQACI